MLEDSVVTRRMIPQNFTTSDGETHEILVLEGFVPETEIKRRADFNVDTWHKDRDNQDRCLASSFNDDTGPHAPTTGRYIAVMEWAASNSGYFLTTWVNHVGGKWPSLVSSEKSGTTACHFRVNHSANSGYVGNTDIRDIVRDALAKFRRQTGGAERLRAYGTAGCEGTLVNDGRMAMRWRID
ncbi:uncharacterized protein B0I36DRAFT_356964 [Microdochium trichocladiopsis]|uniref:Ecp2 effector protein-like domain-containing protein n=1 Tax=Microdochium trichocladiopsis TaxID=1682393 RepID=A0A9P9BT32_9PEZI|nr:uncharacterized protein B0I36DRAFT_356964 [Microdochium trichocladiopsis]KAH7039551.1 hypothetical protein B0I36DRAFT_356964 [Microdochium trichocladiopsis]